MFLDIHTTVGNKIYSCTQSLFELLSSQVYCILSFGIAPLLALHQCGGLPEQLKGVPPELIEVSSGSRHGWNNVFGDPNPVEWWCCKLDKARLLPSLNSLNQQMQTDTTGAAPPQWVFYPVYFLVMLQLAPRTGFHQVGICIMHTHMKTF